MRVLPCVVRPLRAVSVVFTGTSAHLTDSAVPQVERYTLFPIERISRVQCHVYSGVCAVSCFVHADCWREWTAR